jgi:2-phosphoglycerate kinase
MLLQVTEEQYQQIQKEIEEFLKAEGKETITRDERADIVSKILANNNKKSSVGNLNLRQYDINPSTPNFVILQGI